jgi:hypothetical protein
MTWLNVTGHYSLHGNGCNLQTQIVIYNDLLWKFISNSYYFRKIYFLRVTSLHPKFYMPIFLWDVESSPNYTEKLIFAGIGTITLISVQAALQLEIVRFVPEIGSRTKQRVRRREIVPAREGGELRRVGGSFATQCTATELRFTGCSCASADPCHATVTESL